MGMKVRRRKKLAMSKTNSNNATKTHKTAKGSVMAKASKEHVKSHQISKKAEMNGVRVPIIKNPPPTR